MIGEQYTYMYRLVHMYSQSIDEFVQLIYKWSEFTPQLEHTAPWE